MDLLGLYLLQLALIGKLDLTYLTPTCAKNCPDVEAAARGGVCQSVRGVCMRACMCLRARAFFFFFFFAPVKVAR